MQTLFVKFTLGRKLEEARNLRRSYDRTDKSLRRKGCAKCFHYMAIEKNIQVAWASEPYRGQNIDRPSNGPPPPPWDIDVAPGCLFAREEIKREIPHTASVRTCHVCAGLGHLRCIKCKGKRSRRCVQCRGSTKTMQRDAAGQSRKVPCSSCRGKAI